MIGTMAPGLEASGTSIVGARMHVRTATGPTSPVGDRRTNFAASLRRPTFTAATFDHEDPAYGRPAAAKFDHVDAISAPSAAHSVSPT